MASPRAALVQDNDNQFIQDSYTVTIGGTIYWDGSDYQNGGYSYLRQSTLTYQPE